MNEYFDSGIASAIESSWSSTRLSERPTLSAVPAGQAGLGKYRNENDDDRKRAKACRNENRDSDFEDPPRFRSKSFKDPHLFSSYGELGCLDGGRYPMIDRQHTEFSFAPIPSKI
jgi:hypothetical protein